MGVAAIQPLPSVRKVVLFYRMEGDELPSGEMGECLLKYVSKDIFPGLKHVTWIDMENGRDSWKV